MSGGVGAALDQAVKGEADMADIVQAGLFDELEDHETGSLTAPSPLSAALPAARKAGRPKGAKNRRTEAVTAWLLQQHRHPLSVMMEAYSMATHELAARLGLSKEMLEETVTTTTTVDGKVTTIEVTTIRESERFSNAVLIDLFKLQVRMAEAVAPYVAQRLSAGADGAGGNSLNLTFAQLNIGGGAAAQGVSGPARGEVPEFPAGEGMSVRLGQSRTD